MNAAGVVRELVGFLRDFFGPASPQALGEDLLALSTAAVTDRAMTLGDTLVVPGQVVLTLPAEELRLFRSPRLREGLTRALDAAVDRWATVQLDGLRQVHGQKAVLVGADGLAITLVEGEVRRAEAFFDASVPPTVVETPRPPARRADATPDATVDHATVVDADTANATVVDATADATVPDDGLRVTLHSDGRPVGTVRPTPGPLRLGRTVGATLIVPETKENVSREALVLTRGAVDTVDVLVLNRNGAWMTPASDGPGPARRARVPAGDQVTLGIGDRLDLDRAGTVGLTVEGHRPPP